MALPEFDILRQQVKQRATAAGQEAGGAIKRRFAALGGLNTGASIKAEQLAREKAQKIATGELGQLDVAEAAEERRRTEADRAFNLQETSTLRGLDLAERELSLNEDIAKFNKEMAKWQQGQPTDIFGQLLGPQFSTSKWGGYVGKAFNPVKSIGGLF